jgi:hypothetical protein
MAGPVAAVLFGSSLGPARVERVRRLVRERAAVVEGDDCWIDQRPFIVSMGEEYPGAMQEVMDTGLPSLLGWHEVDTIRLAAMCNDPIDHQLLAELCLLIARTGDTVVDFHGELIGGAALSDQNCVVITPPTPLPGKLYQLQQPRDDGSFIVTQAGDAAFLAGWLRSPQFRMIK